MSCTSKVYVHTDYPNGFGVDTLNLTATMIGPLQLPVLPLIDASIFNDKPNSIASDIITEEQKVIDDYQSILIQSLEQNLHVKVIPSSKFSSESANEFMVRDGAVQVANNNFPLVLFSQGGINVVDFGKKKDPYDIFKDNPEINKNIAKLANELHLKTVLLSFNQLIVTGVNMLGIYGTLRLESYLYLFNKDGKLLIDVFGKTKSTHINGKELSDYKFQLDSFRDLAEQMSIEVKPYIK